MPARKNKKKRNISRSNKAYITGLVFSWDDEAPLTEGSSIKANVTHKNPYHRLSVNSLMNDYGESIRKDWAFSWKLDIDIHCHNGKNEYVNGAELKAVCRFTEINKAAEEVIQELINDGNENEYMFFRFTAEILGTCS